MIRPARFRLLRFVLPATLILLTHITEVVTAGEHKTPATDTSAMSQIVPFQETGGHDLAGLAPCSATAASTCTNSPYEPWSSSFCEQQYLTGDWSGTRTTLSENGIGFTADVASFYMGVTRGGLERAFRHAGHADYVLNMDAGRLGLQEGLFIKLRAEHRFGNSINDATGAVFPATLATDLPVRDSDHLYLTNVLFTQAFSPNFAVFFGKLDTLDGDVNEFAHQRGTRQFSNVAFVANPIALRTIPYSTLGAGFVVLDQGEPIFTFTVLNPTDTARTSGFDELFSDGVALSAELRLPTEFFGMQGHQLFAGTWSSRDFVALGQDPRVIFPNVPINRVDGSWSLYWNFDQYLVNYARNDHGAAGETKGWGIFGRAGIADDRANPLATFLSFGIGGDSPIYGRENDSFGLGWYFAGTSDRVGRILQTALGPVGDGQGVEAYYNIAVTPYLQVTPDLQVIMPARDQVETAVFAGIRTLVSF